MKCIQRGALILALCLLSWASLWAAPISPSSPGTTDLYQPSEALAADPSTSVREFVFTVAPDRASLEYPSSLELAAFTAAVPEPPAASLLLIGAAMIWIAGVIRYSLKGQA